MAAIDGLSSALASMADGRKRAAAAAARLGAGPDIDAIVDLKLARAQVDASVKVARAYDELLGSIIDDQA